MLALVISDSHGAREKLRDLMVLSEKQIRPDALIFCGDGVQDILPYRAVYSDLWAVRGNCDLCLPPDIPMERTQRANGLWIYITHGHALRVKHTLLSLSYRAQEVGAKVACFGHTHRPMAQWEQGILLLNPGALADGCYAVLVIGEGGAVQARLERLAT